MKKSGKIILGIAGGFAALIVISAVASAGGSPAAPVAAPATTWSSSSPAPSTWGDPLDGQATTQPTQAAAPVIETPAGPATTITAGTYEVGTDMVAGKYKGKCDTNGYWARLGSDDPSDIVANDWQPNGGPMTFTTKKGEYVNVGTTCTFAKVG